jgi:hypothetical protein
MSRLAHVVAIAITTQVKVVVVAGQPCIDAGDLANQRAAKQKGLIFVAPLFGDLYTNIEDIAMP